MDCDHGGETATAVVARDGSFEFAALVPGDAALRYLGRRGHVARHLFCVREGDQDLGVVAVSRLGVLCLELVGVDPSTERAFATLLRPAHRDRFAKSPLSFRVMTLNVARGACSIEQVLDGAICGVLWTEGGEIGEIPESLCTFAAESVPVRVQMRQAGGLVVEIGGDVPAGCIAVAVDARYQRRPGALEVREFAAAHLRARQAAVHDGFASLGRLWPGRYRIAVVTEHGGVLAEGESEVDSDQWRVASLRVGDAWCVLEAVNVGRSAVRVALLSDDGGIAGRVTIPGLDKVEIRAQRPGSYQVIAWVAEDGEERSVLHRIELRHSERRTFEVGGR